MSNRTEGPFFEVRINKFRMIRSLDRSAARVISELATRALSEQFERVDMGRLFRVVNGKPRDVDVSCEIRNLSVRPNGLLEFDLNLDAVIHDHSPVRMSFGDSCPVPDPAPIPVFRFARRRVVAFLVGRGSRFVDACATAVRQH